MRPAILLSALAFTAPALAQMPNAPPLRPELDGLLDLADGGARLVEVPRAPLPAVEGRYERPYDFIETNDGAVYQLAGDRIHCWPPGAEGDDGAITTPASVRFAGLIDGVLTSWSAIEGPDRRRLIEQRFTACGPGFGEASRGELDEDIGAPFLTPLPARTSGLLFARGPETCAVGVEGIGCADFDAEAPAYAMWLTAEAIAERLPGGAAFAREVLASTPELPQDRPITYRLRDAVGLPDGRLAVIVSAELPSLPDLRPFVNSAVLIDPAADTVTDLVEPTIQVLGGRTAFDNPLGEAETIHYDPEWNAIWVGRLLGWLPSSMVISIPTIGSVDDVVTEGRTGVGYRVIPLDEPHGRTGYMDLTNAYFWLDPCELDRPESCVPAARLGFAAVDDRQGRIWFKPGRAFERRALVFDRQAVDLDGDGLSRAEEAALGTSDFSVDSDGDGSTDRIEPLVGRDPTVADGPEIAEVPRLIASSNVLAGVPPAGDGPGGEGHGYARRGPYCEVESVVEAGARLSRGRCRDLAGRILAEWRTDTNADRPIVSADGRYVLFSRFDGLYRIDFATGEEALWISAADMHARIGDAITGGPESGFLAFQHWVPVDGDTLFYGTSFDRFSPTPKGRFPRYERLDGPPGGPLRFTTLLDTAVDFCDQGLVRCTDEPLGELLGAEQDGPPAGLPYELSGFWTVPMGWHHELGRFLVGVGGHQESVILGFHPTDPPVRLGRARGLYPTERPAWITDETVDWCVPFPGNIHALGEGIYRVGDQIWRGPGLERLPIGLPARTTAQRYGCGLGETRPYVAEWGSATIEGHIIDRQRGMLTVEALEVEPGDTLFLSAVNELATGFHHDDFPEGRMLYALGPLVGVRPVWALPDPDLVRGTGMDVARDGRLCIADRPGQQVIEYLPAPGTRSPRIKGHHLTDVDAIDCMWLDERLLVLTADAVLELRPEGHLAERERHGARIPVDLLPARGGWQVLDRGAAGAPAGFVRLQDGGLEPIDPGSLSEGPFDADIQVAIDAREPTSVVHAVERPDGTVLMAHATTSADPAVYGPEVFAIYAGVLMRDGRGGLRRVADPWGTTGGQPAPGTGYFQALAQVPGGEVDVWRGAKGPVCWFDPTLPECVVERAPDGGPDAGVPPLGGDFDDSGDLGDDYGLGCGCDAGRGAAPGPALLLLALLGLRRRRDRPAEDRENIAIGPPDR